MHLKLSSFARCLRTLVGNLQRPRRGVSGNSCREALFFLRPTCFGGLRSKVIRIQPRFFVHFLAFILLFLVIMSPQCIPSILPLTHTHTHFFHAHPQVVLGCAGVGSLGCNHGYIPKVAGLIRILMVSYSVTMQNDSTASHTWCEFGEAELKIEILVFN